MIFLFIYLFIFIEVCSICVRYVRRFANLIGYCKAIGLIKALAIPNVSSSNLFIANAYKIRLTFLFIFRHRGDFFRLVDEGQLDWENEEHRDLLRSMLMTASDVSAITKPWDVQKRASIQYIYRSCQL